GLQSFAVGARLGIVGVGIGHVGSSRVADQFTKPAQSFGFPCLRIPDVPFSVRNRCTYATSGADAAGKRHLQAPHCTELENLMKATCLSAITAAAALALVAACGATEQPGGQDTAPDVAQSTPQATTPDIARITAVIEEAG